MSKQLAVSAAFSVFAMAAFALFAAPLTGLSANEKGAPAYASAPLSGAGHAASALINH